MNLRETLRSILLLVPYAIIVVVLLVGVERRGYRHLSNDKTSSSSTESSNEGDVSLSLKPFNPNTADYRTFVEAGVPRGIAVSLLKWRASGKVFRIKEDLALCYNMTDSLYFALEPYIVIDDSVRIKPGETGGDLERDTKQRVIAEPAPFRVDTVGATYLYSIGFSRRQADLVIRYRDMIGGYRNFDEFKECYGVSEDMAALLEPYVIFDKSDDVGVSSGNGLIDINRADSTTLCTLYGIGPKSAQAILRYRQLLGGYHDKRQILELEVVTDENFMRFCSQIYCDSSVIKKIYINFARPNEFVEHPYLGKRSLKRIINTRELKGGWSTIEEMIEDDIFSVEEARRIAPYLDFGTSPM